MPGFLNLNQRRGRNNFAPVLVVGVVGVVASLLFWYLTVASEDRASAAEFSGRASNQAVVLQSGLNDYRDKLYAVRALFDSSKTAVTREQFETFSNSVIEGHRAILNVSWFPRVRRDERAAHELAAARDGLSDYHIRLLGPDASLPISPERDEYLPKFYSTEVRSSPIYGGDLNDGGVRERTVGRIRDGNVASTSPPLVLHIGEGDRNGFWAGLPVYARGQPHETVEERRRNLLGIVQVVFQTAVMIDNIMSGVKTPVRIYLFAPDAAADALSTYSMSRLDLRPIAPMSQEELVAGPHRSLPLRFGDVEWTLVVTPEPTPLWSIGHERSWIVLICGLALSGGLTAFVWAMRRYAREIEAVNDRFEHQNVRFDAALNNMAQGLLMYDGTGRLIISNRRFAEVFRMPWEKWKELSPGTTLREAMELARDLTHVTEKNESEIVRSLHEIVTHRRSGKLLLERTDDRTLSASCAAMTDGGLVITFEDITENHRIEERISHMARYDALTDLPNRMFFYEKMADVLARVPGGGAFAVFSLDLDGFKGVNDTLGHPIGDKLLQAVAERMRGCVRETDIVARLGGDEFVIVQVEFGAQADVTALAERLIAAINAPYRLDDHQVMVATSIGIAMFPGDGVELDCLMKNADLALYRSKADGGSTYRFFEAKMDARTGAPRSRCRFRQGVGERRVLN
jgi:diguanylate cyclase (GGDEF)-like protein